MSMHDHLARRNKNAHQRQPAREDQVKNHAGGYVFQLSSWDLLDRFLILGTTGGTYYANERQATLEAVGPLLDLIRSAEGVKVVNRVVEISRDGRAPKNDSAILILGMCLSHGDVECKNAAVKAVPQVCRIGTHLFQLMDVLQGQRGWGRVAKRAVREWFRGKDTNALSYQAVKYPQREGWSLRDALRLSHYKVNSEHRNSVLAYITHPDKQDGYKNAPELVHVVRELAVIGTGLSAPGATIRPEAAKRCADMIAAHRVPREAVPTPLLNEPVVWEALLEDMPMTALIRTLGRLSGDKLGLIKPMSQVSLEVAERITDAQAIQRARVHPLTLLNALVTYRSGRGLRSSASWTVAPEIVEALTQAHFMAYKHVEATGKRFYLGIDVSGSMGMWTCGQTSITAAQGAACIAQVTNVVEPYTYVAGFCGQMRPIELPKQPVLNDGLFANAFGTTDCALPMLDAMEKGIEVDTFVIYTDNETYAGRVHPYKALRQYREQTGINAKLVVVGMTSTGFSIADPDDAGMLDVVGFDTATPQAISAFAVA